MTEINLRVLFISKTHSHDEIVILLRALFLGSFSGTNPRVLPETDFTGRSKTVEIDGTTRLDANQIFVILENLSSATQIPWIELKNLSMILSVKRAQVESRIRIGEFSFGTFADSNTFQKHFSPYFVEKEAEFEHDCFPGLMNVYFTTNPIDIQQSRVHKLEISYDNIVRILVSERTCYFFLKNPGRMFRAKPFKGPVNTLTRVNERSAWVRAVAPPEWDERVVGKCNVLEMSILDLSFLRILSRIQRSGRIPIFWTMVTVREATSKRASDPMLLSDRFDCLYAWQSFLSRGFQVTERLTLEFQQTALACFRNDPERGKKSLYSLIGLIDNNLWFDLLDGFKHFYEFYEQHPRLIQSESIPNYQYVRRAIKTPTRLIFLQPEIMHENRVLRRYQPEFALRLSFRDEDICQRLSSGFMTVDGNLYERTIVQPLNQGIQLGNRNFEFLGWSNSQMKDHCVWLYAQDTNESTAEDIRSQSGDFSSINSVQKYCARWAQCMTQTEESVKIEVHVEDEMVSYEEDIQDAAGIYTFSDGIGRISPSLVEKVCRAIRAIRNQRRMIPPCAYQIRYAGCKGMLASDPTLKGDRIIFRNSQKKFDVKDSRPRVLELAKYSQPSKVMLNRPMISILEHLRTSIPHGYDVFHELQEKQLMAMSEMLLYEDQALHQLRTKTNLPLFYSCLAGNGICFTTEPFFRDLLLAINRKVNSNLAKKARIEIPLEYGRNLLGVMDETEFLRYGEIFLQYSERFDRPRENTTVLKGKVVVTKNPCMHPGDVRVFKAVDVAQLHHMVDVIVFPQTGHRPHPDEMAGSDLDGDEYQAIWLPEMLFEGNAVPMDFPKQKAREYFGPITTSRMIEWFREFVEKDQVGLISSAHMAHADTQGIDSHICKTLAAKHSIAVDFQKTGNGTTLNEYERVKSYPDFMGKRYRSHRSTKILGQLYRKATRVEQLSVSSIRSKPEIKLDPTLLHPDRFSYRDSARSERDAYFGRIQELMSQYGIENESELISGHILRMRMVLMERSELYDVEAILRIHVKNLQKNSREKFLEEFGGLIDIPKLADPESGIENLVNLNGELYQRMLAKASAYYEVTYDTSSNSNGLLSFPWVVVGDLLGRVKKDTLKSNTPLSLNLSTAIGKQDVTWNLGLNPRLDIMLKSAPAMRHLIAVILRWAKRNGVFRPNSDMSPDVIAALVLKFCSERQDNENVGLLCLKIIQHWGSQKFRNHGETLTELHQKGILNYGRYAGGRIMHLHFAAFNTFHRLAIMGRFYPLCLTDAVPVDQAEASFDVSDFPRYVLEMDVMEHNACFNVLRGPLLSRYSEDQVTALAQEKLQELTGMEGIDLRILSAQKNTYRWIFSGLGSAVAREKLTNILVSKQLVSALTGGSEVVDNMLVEP